MAEAAGSPRPVVAVLAVVLRGEQVLLVQRANSPDAGLWGFPGGKVEFGEALLDAAARELFEETGVTALPLRVFDAVDAWDRPEGGALRRHFVLVAVLCAWQGGEPVAADDAADARWVALGDLGRTLPLSKDVAAMARRAATLGAAAG